MYFFDHFEKMDFKAFQYRGSPHRCGRRRRKEGQAPGWRIDTKKYMPAALELDLSRGHVPS